MTSWSGVAQACLPKKEPRYEYLHGKNGTYSG